MLKIGVVGTGGMGKVHLSNYKYLDNCKVVAICDPAQEAKKTAEELNCALYNDINEMLADCDVDVVDICTPTFLHKTHVMAALNAGKHVICEKPIALHLSDAEEMINKAEEKKVYFNIGQVLQYSAEVIFLRDLIKSEKYGKVLDANFIRLSACPSWVKNGWLFDKEKSGHLPFDLHIHDLDLIVSLFGEPSSVSAVSCGNSGKNYKEHFRINYKINDINVCAEAAWFNANYPFNASWRVYFENAVAENDKGKLTIYPAESDAYCPEIIDDPKIPTGINLPPTGMFYRELSDFTKHIQAGEIGCPRKKELLAVVKILEGINND